MCTLRVLIAVISCHTRQIYANAIRETWLPLVQGADVRFFRGHGATREPLPDEVWLDCPDDYASLPSKVQAVIRWALENGYDALAKCDDDVVLKPKDFLSSGFHLHDFNGHTNDDRASAKTPWGFLYTLSKRSMEIMAQAPLPPNNNDEAWTANTLVGHGIVLHNEPRYYLHRGKRRDFIPKAPRPLRAPPRLALMEEDTPGNGIAYAVFLHWSGFHATPDEVNIKEYYKLFKETQ
jgi:hypothetical protein